MFTLAALGSGDVRDGAIMGRFFFDLQGVQNTNDPTGLAFETELDAFRAAQRLAAEIGSARPQLCGNAWVAVVSRKRDGEAYYVSV
jgi:hypothetical protein